jgi:hypothetical protein
MCGEAWLCGLPPGTRALAPASASTLRVRTSGREAAAALHALVPESGAEKKVHDRSEASHTRNEVAANAHKHTCRAVREPSSSVGCAISDRARPPGPRVAAKCTARTAASRASSLCCGALAEPPSCAQSVAPAGAYTREHAHGVKVSARATSWTARRSNVDRAGTRLAGHVVRHGAAAQQLVGQRSAPRKWWGGNARQALGFRRGSDSGAVQYWLFTAATTRRTTSRTAPPPPQSSWPRRPAARAWRSRLAPGRRGAPHETSRRLHSCWGAHPSR